MEDKAFLRKKRILTIVVIAFVVGITVFVIFSLANKGDNAAMNPNQDPYLGLEDGTGDGITAAVLYNSENLYQTLGQNDDVLYILAEDMLLFARSTLTELSSPDTLVGFTFKDDVRQEGDTVIYNGVFFGADDEIEVSVTPRGRGVYTLSITNLNSEANIDSQLRLNGNRNTFIRTLPIEKGSYSIRYQVPQDKIIVTFYDGYDSQDVDEALTFVTNGLGSLDSPRIVYSINRIGIVSIEQVRQNLVTPIPLP